MTSAKIILDTRSSSKKGHPIKIRVQNVKARYVNLYEYSFQKYWNGTVLPSHPDFKRLKNKLIQREAELLREVEYCNENRLDLEAALKIIKNGIGKDPETEIFLLQKKIRELQTLRGMGLLEFYEVRIREKKEAGKSYAAYKQTKDQLSQFVPEDLNINEIDYGFLNRFVNHKFRNGCRQAGINFYLKNMRAVYKEAQKRTELAIKQDNPFLGFIKTAPSKMVEVPEKSELLEIFNARPPKGTTRENAFKMNRNLAVFKFQFLIGGHDYVDVSLLEWKDIKNGRARFMRYKNRNKSALLVDNLIPESAIEIIETYGTKKNKRVFGFVPDIRESEEKYNQYRKNVSRSLRGFHPVLRTKLPRYIFRTYAGMLSVDTLIISQIQGHKMQGETFAYQQRLPYHVQDQWHVKVIEGF